MDAMPFYTRDILKNLEDFYAAKDKPLTPPYHYLDKESVHHIYQDITGLVDTPRLHPGPKEQGGPLVSSLDKPGGLAVPLHILFEAMQPVLKAIIPFAENAEDLNSRVLDYAWIKGTMQSSRFPDGNLNLEISFGDVRGMLFFSRSYFSSMIRPLLIHDRFHEFSSEVEALVLVRAQVQSTIFYHQSYGDNMEHLWAPIVPAAVKGM